MGNNVVYYSSVKNLAELCKGSTADSDSVCLGSNPSSAAIKNAPLKSRGAFFIAANSGFDPVFCPKGKTWVRIPHPKIDKLACQAQGVGIFTAGEITLIDAYCEHFY